MGNFEWKLGHGAVIRKVREIALKGARLHNLKNIDVSIPKNKLTAATGVSGSGKSSLVFDIIFEEGRRQYLRSLGILTGIEDENKFDSITGISPTIAVQQSIIRQSNPRSTVGTRTGILNMLAVLYAIEGQPACRDCQTPVDSNLTCPKCGNKEERLPANYFSYNSPNGMCPKCSGKGAYFEINLEKLVPNNQMTLQDVFDRVKPTPGYANLLYKRFNEHLKVPFSELPDEVKADVIYGHFVESNYDKRSYCLTRILQGGLYQNPEMQDVYAMAVCSVCHGFRVGEEAQRVHLNGKHIGELGKMTINELQSFLTQLQGNNKFTAFGQNLLKDTLDKTNNLIKARLGHLSLYREMPTLSGGEIQRLFLNSHLDSKMDSLIYILDEPTVGLHESEKNELLESIKALKELGNTVIVVEHDENTIAMAEHVIDIGPKAGVEGGQVVYQGNYKGLIESKTSITGQYLSGKAAMPSRNTHLNQPTANLTIKHAKTNNLKDVTASFPLGGLVGVAGVSGSGKSSLVSDTLVPLLKNYFHDDQIKDETAAENETAETEVVETVAEKLEGIQHLSGYAEVSQAPIGRNVTSNPASYIGIWDKIRKLFANQPEAVAIMLWAANVIDWTLTFPVVMLVFGCWMLALAVMQSNKPIKYTRGPFGTAALGVCLIAVGGGWFLLSVTGNFLYALALVLIVVAALAIAAALKHK